MKFKVGDMVRIFGTATIGKVVKVWGVGMISPYLVEMCDTLERRACEESDLVLQAGDFKKDDVIVSIHSGEEFVFGNYYYETSTDTFWATDEDGVEGTYIIRDFRLKEQDDQVSSALCPDCKGTGEIMLFTSTVECGCNGN